MKNKLLMSIRWVGVMLIVMGLIFGGTAAFACFYVLQEGNMTPDEAALFCVIFGGMFGFFTIVMWSIGTIILARAHKRNCLKKRLIEAGNYAWADILNVSANSGVRINGHAPLILRCRHRYTDGNTYVFKSEFLRYDPQPELKDSRVKVWFDPDDIKKYYVDVESGIDSNYIEL